MSWTGKIEIYTKWWCHYNEDFLQNGTKGVAATATVKILHCKFSLEVASNFPRLHTFYSSIVNQTCLVYNRWSCCRISFQLSCFLLWHSLPRTGKKKCSLPPRTVSFPGEISFQTCSTTSCCNPAFCIPDSCCHQATVQFFFSSSSVPSCSSHQVSALDWVCRKPGQLREVVATFLLVQVLPCFCKHWVACFCPFRYVFL